MCGYLCLQRSGQARYVPNVRPHIEVNKGSASVLSGASNSVVRTGGSHPNGSSEIFSMLASVSPDQQKQILGEQLYPLVMKHKVYTTTTTTTTTSNTSITWTMAVCQTKFLRTCTKFSMFKDYLLLQNCNNVCVEVTWSSRVDMLLWEAETRIVLLVCVWVGVKGLTRVLKAAMLGFWYFSSIYPAISLQRVLRSALWAKWLDQEVAWSNTI